MSSLAQTIVDLQQQLAACRESGDRTGEGKLYLQLSRSYEDLGEVVKAFEHYKLHASIRDEIICQQQQQELSELEGVVDAEMKQRQQDIIRLKLLRLELALRHQDRQIALTLLDLLERHRLMQSIREEIGAGGTGYPMLE